MAFETYSSGDTYSGDLLNGVRHGQVTYTWATSGNVDTGTFVDGNQHGQGIYNYANVNVYTGACLDGARHGQVTFRSTQRKAIISKRDVS